MAEPLNASDPAALLCDIADGIAVITISNTAKRNVMTVGMWAALPPLLQELAANPAVRVVVLRGAGDTFCAGADVSSLSEMLDPDGPSMPARAESALADFAKPTIAAVAGYCIGGGVQLAVACDLRIASEDAKFAITPAKFGVVYQAAAVTRLVELVGRSTAKRLLFSAEMVTADHAQSASLVDSVVTSGRLHEQVAVLARTIASRSQITVQATKSFIAAIGQPEHPRAPRAIVAGRGRAERRVSRGPAGVLRAARSAVPLDRQRPAVDNPGGP